MSRLSEYRLDDKLFLFDFYAAGKTCIGRDETRMARLQLSTVWGISPATSEPIQVKRHAST